MPLSDQAAKKAKLTDRPYKKADEKGALSLVNSPGSIGGWMTVTKASASHWRWGVVHRPQDWLARCVRSRTSTHRRVAHSHNVAPDRAGARHWSSRTHGEVGSDSTQTGVAILIRCLQAHPRGVIRRLDRFGRRRVRPAIQGRECFSVVRVLHSSECREAFLTYENLKRRKPCRLQGGAPSAINRTGAFVGIIYIFALPSSLSKCWQVYE